MKPKPTKPCTCLEELEKNLTEHHGPDSRVCLGLKTVMRIKPDKTAYDMSFALPPLYYSYQQGKKRKKSYVTFSFCPFCGQKR